MMILLRAFQSLQAESILLKLTFRLLRQEQLFLNSQSQKSFLSLRARRRKPKKSISQINRMSFRLLLIQSHFKYDSSILTKKYSLFLSIKTFDLQNINLRLSSIKTF